MLDTQGYELTVLRGSTGLLSKVDAIITEVSRVYDYKGQTQIEDLDKLLAEHKFLRVQTLPSWSLSHGDALYVKTHLLPKAGLNDLRNARRWYEKTVVIHFTSLNKRRKCIRGA